MMQYTIAITVWARNTNVNSSYCCWGVDLYDETSSQKSILEIPTIGWCCRLCEPYRADLIHFSSRFPQLFMWMNEGRRRLREKGMRWVGKDKRVLRRHTHTHTPKKRKEVHVETYQTVHPFAWSAQYTAWHSCWGKSSPSHRAEEKRRKWHMSWSNEQTRSWRRAGSPSFVTRWGIARPQPCHARSHCS